MTWDPRVANKFQGWTRSIRPRRRPAPSGGWPISPARHHCKLMKANDTCPWCCNPGSSYEDTPGNGGPLQGVFLLRRLQGPLPPERRREIPPTMSEGAPAASPLVKIQTSRMTAEPMAAMHSRAVVVRPSRAHLGAPMLQHEQDSWGNNCSHTTQTHHEQPQMCIDMGRAVALHWHTHTSMHNAQVCKCWLRSCYFVVDFARTRPPMAQEQR